MNDNAAIVCVVLIIAIYFGLKRWTEHKEVITGKRDPHQADREETARHNQFWSERR